jgi:small subunit ribosomal protein S15
MKTSASVAKQFGSNEKDSGSVPVQIALLTERINHLAGHFEKNKSDASGKRGLMKLIGRRRSLLKYLNLKNPKGYEQLLEKLNLRK